MVPPITHEEFLEIGYRPYTLVAWRRDEIKRLSEQYHFFHWQISFPNVFRLPGKDEVPVKEQAGWSGGFDVVLGQRARSTAVIRKGASARPSSPPVPKRPIGQKRLTRW